LILGDRSGERGRCQVIHCQNGNADYYAAASFHVTFLSLAGWVFF
jgi:hypothetical protein